MTILLKLKKEEMLLLIYSWKENQSGRWQESSQCTERYWLCAFTRYKTVQGLLKQQRDTVDRAHAAAQRQ
jgi:hypothetical protein